MDDQSLDLVGSMIELFFKKTSTLIANSKTGFFGLDDERYILSELDDFQDPENNTNIKPWLGVTADRIRSLPPLVMETYIDLRNVDSSHTVYLRDLKESGNWAVCKGGKKNEIVLERWLLELDTEAVSQQDQHLYLDEDDLTSFFQNKLSLLLRYLYTLITLLPANDLHSRLLRNFNTQSLDNMLKVSTRILDGTKPILSKGRIGLSKPIIPVDSASGVTHLEQKRVPPITTSVGLLRVNVSYRKSTDFYLVDETYKPGVSKPLKTANTLNQQQNINITNSHTSTSPQTFSGSPLSGNFLNINDQNLSSSSASRRSSTHTRSSFQPFKVGSVGSGSSAIPLARNPSNSSVIATLRAQRSSNGSINVPVSTNGANVSQPTLTPNIATSYDGVSKNSVDSRFSSSFDKVRRHSSVRKSDESIKGFRSRTSSVGPQQQVAVSLLNHNEEHASKPPYKDDEIVDFMNLLNSKKELKLNSASPHGSQEVKKHDQRQIDSISDSLIKFKIMKQGNDNFSDNMSMSISMLPTKSSENLTENPPFGFSPQQTFGMDGLRNSFDKQRVSFASSRKSGHSSGDELFTRPSSINQYERRASNSSQTFGSHHLLNSDILRSSSPTYSINRFASSMSKVSNMSPNDKFLEPTTASTAAYGNFHKPKESVFAVKNKSKTALPNNDDDDLLFFMSDMNKNE